MLSAATARAKRGPEDRALAERQRFCAVLEGSRLGSMGKPVAVVVGGQRVFVCCTGCVKAAEGNPDKTLKRVEELRSKGAEYLVFPQTSRWWLDYYGNLHDHLDVFMMYNVKDVESYDAYKKTMRKIMPGIQYALFRNGPAAGTIVEGGAFCWTDKDLEAPDLQYHFLPGTGVEEVNDTAETVTGNGCTLNGYFMHPRARGAVTLKSADPRVPILKRPAGAARGPRPGRSDRRAAAPP